MSLFDRINAQALAAKEAQRKLAAGWWRVPEKWEGAWVDGRPVEWQAVRNVRADARLNPKRVSAYVLRKRFPRLTVAQRLKAAQRIVYAHTSYQNAAIWYAVLSLLAPRPLPTIQWLNSPSGGARRRVLTLDDDRRLPPPLVANCVLRGVALDRVHRGEYVFGMPAIGDGEEDGYVFDVEAITDDLERTIAAHYDTKLEQLRMLSGLFDSLERQNLALIERRRNMQQHLQSANQRQLEPRGKRYKQGVLVR